MKRLMLVVLLCSLWSTAALADQTVFLNHASQGNPGAASCTPSTPSCAERLLG
jgi:hypothetical protein